MPGENPTTKFKIDISDLKKNITEANRQVKLYRAELANASAGMAKGEETAESLTKKIEAQSKIVEAEKKKLSALKEELQRYEKKLESGEKEVADLTKKHEAAAKQFGEDSKEAKELAKQLAEAQKAQERNGKAADDLRVKIVQQDTAVKNAEGQTRRFSQSLDDLQKEEKQTGDEAEKTTSGGLQAFTVALGNLAANAITAAIKKLGELGKAAIDASKDFDDGRDALIKATGAIGSAADELTDAYSKTAKSVAGDLSDIGGAVGQVNTYFGYIGDELSDTSADFLRFADITGTDASSAVQKVARVLKASGEELDSYGHLLDVVAHASQASGISADSLLTSLDANGAALRAMNFSLEDSVAMLAKWEESGANGTAMLAGLKKATVSWQKDGKDANTELASAIHLISSAKDETEAAQIATETFGKSGTEMADAIRRGAMDYSDFAELLKDSAGAVANTYEETQSGFDKINLALQGLKVTAGQAMSGLVEEFSSGIENVIGLVSKVLEGDDKALTELSGAVSTLIGEALQKAVEALPAAIDFAVDLVTSLADAVIDVLPAALSAITDAAATALPKLVKFAVTVVQKIAEFLKNNLDPLLAAAGDIVAAITATLLDPATIAALVKAAGDIVTAVAEALAGDGMESLLEAVTGIIEAVVNLLLSPEYNGAFAEAGAKILAALVKALVTLTPELIGMLYMLVENITNQLLATDWGAVGMSLVEGVLNGAQSVDLSEFWDKWFAGAEDIKTAMKSVGDFCLKIWDGIVRTWSQVSGFFRKQFTDAYNGIKSVFSNIGSFFAGIWERLKGTFSGLGTKVGNAIGGAFKAAINSVLATVERNLNAIPGAINRALDVINQIPGVNIGYMSGISLPRLAYGAIIDKPTIAQIGEAGKEAVIPLEHNKQGLREIAGLLAAEMGTGYGNGGRVQGGTTVTLTQNISSPKALSQYDIWRQTKNMLQTVKLQGV